jgi:ribosomal protein S17E
MDAVEKPQDADVETAPELEADLSEAPEGASAEGPETTPPEQPEQGLEGAETTPAEPPAEIPESETEPFGFTADRRRFEVPGAEIVRFKDDQGNPVEKIVMDRDAFARFVQPHLRDGSAVHKREIEYKRQIEALGPDRNETVIRARSLVASLEGVLKDEQSLTAFLQDFDRNKELWQLKADKAVSDARISGYTTQETEQQRSVRAEEEAAQVVQDIPAVMGGAAEFVSQNWNVSVDQRAIAAAQEHIAEHVGSYYRYATQQDADQFGVEVGQLIRDDDAVIRTVHRFATLLSSGKAAEDAKTKNAAALGGGKPAPKTVSAKGSPAPADKPRSFKSKDEWQRAMGLNT